MYVGIIDLESNRTTYYGMSIDEKPKKANEGDILFELDKKEFYMLIECTWINLIDNMSVV